MIFFFPISAPVNITFLYLHKHDIIHTDLKPENIALVSDRTATVNEFSPSTGEFRAKVNILLSISVLILTSIHFISHF